MNWLSNTRSPAGPVRRPGFYLAMLFVLLAGLAGSANATTLNVPGSYADIQTAINASVPFDVVLVAPGTYVVTTTINANVADVTIQGSGIGSTTLQVASAVGNMMYISASGVTLRDFTIEKTDLPGVHELIWINAQNVTIRNNEIFGPDPVTPWSVNGIVSRAMVVSNGSSGLSIHDNTIYQLRQPAYIDGPATTGTIANNVVYGTRGWVIAGAPLTFTGNSWGVGGGQGADIALLSTCTALDYPDLLALSIANTNAYISGQFAGASSGRATSYVDDSAAPGGFGMSTNPYQTIATGITETLPGGTVSVAAGSYTEQVVVNGKNLTIQGAGAASTTIVSPAVLATSFATPTVRKPVVLCQGATDIRVQGLTIDGADMGNANNSFIGVAWWNAGGKLMNCDVKRVEDSPFSGAQHGVGIYASSNTGGPYALEVGSCNVTDFQKNGTVFASSAMTVDVHDCTITGKGATGVTAQNGIQISSGAGGTITNCAVSGTFYTGMSTAATGQLFFGGSSVTVIGGSVTNCQNGTYFYDTNGSMTGTSTNTAISGGLGAWAVSAYNSSLSMMPGRHDVTEGDMPPRPTAQPMDDGTGDLSQSPGTGVLSGLSVTVTGGCITGSGAVNTEGLDFSSAGGGLTATATGIEISNCHWGIWAGGPGTSVNAHHNAITSNTIGYEGLATGTHLAEKNWWGNLGGPGVGGANPVVGATVDYTPWLITGTDLTPGCGFTAAGDNVITPGPAPSCITPATPCVTIPVDIARNTSENMRGYSVTFQLSANLQLCVSPGASITQGTYLSNISGTNFQVLDNGGKSYTVDCAILGATCGATAATGNLFNVNVMKDGVPDGTGTITVTSVIARDCVNAPISVSPGAPLSITIDNAAPTAIANLLAVQKKLANPAVPAGTTDITLTFSGVEPGATVKVYRAGFGHYPEYDDAGGVAPTVPSYPPPLPVNTWDWTLTSVTASGQVDRTATRDFYYYVAFVIDPCGNVSAASNLMGGTLNYHLGDVTNGTPGTGDNLVGTIDMSLLGANYGINLVLNDPVNYLDVGATTDFSVNARPTTDNKVQFEDLIMFAINYGQVSKPSNGPPVEAAAADAVRLDVPAMPEAGKTFVVGVNMSSTGQIQGISLNLDYDHTVVVPVAVEAGELMGRQSSGGLVLSSAPGNVDAAILGTGAAIVGSGELARVTFRVLNPGDARLGLLSSDARDTENRKVNLNVTSIGTGVKPVLATFLGANYPNPFHGSTQIPMGLKSAGNTKLAVFDVTGRLVRTLVDGPMEAGQRVVEWDGRDNGGQSVASGFYVIRLTAPDEVRTRSVKVVR